MYVEANISPMKSLKGEAAILATRIFDNHILFSD
jgi:hypothetical protein